MDILKELENIVKEFKNVEGVTEDTSFDSLDLDSLDKVDILMQVEEKFDIELPEDIAITTVGELVSAIKKLV